MAEFYPQLKLLHIALVLTSGAVFFLRGTMLLFEFPLGENKGLKRFSYINDTFLLLAGVALLWVPVNNLLHNPWLFMKWGLLALYIALGIYAFRPGRSKCRRLIGFLLALGVYYLMFTVARSHHPFGVFSTL